jgi:hypothetical protein
MKTTEPKPLTTASLLITSVVTIMGFFIVGQINAYNDKTNKLREVKINYLIDAYTKLANGSQRPINAASYHRDFELAVSQIQLFGSAPELSALDKALENSRDISNQDTLKLNVDSVLITLRNSLRREMDLDPIDKNVEWFRFDETITTGLHSFKRGPQVHRLMASPRLSQDTLHSPK